MLVILIFLSLICLFLRVFYYERSLGEGVTNSLLSLTTKMFSFRYLLPIKSDGDKSKEALGYQKRAGLFLTLFYVLLVIIMIYSIIYAALHDGSVY